MKAIAIPACLSVLATLAMLWNAQASSIQQRVTRFLAPAPTHAQPTQQAIPAVNQEPQVEINPVPQASQPQPAPQDPRRILKDPCPACGMG